MLVCESGAYKNISTTSGEITKTFSVDVCGLHRLYLYNLCMWQSYWYLSLLPPSGQNICYYSLYMGSLLQNWLSTFMMPKIWINLILMTCEDPVVPSSS